MRRLVVGCIAIVALIVTAISFATIRERYAVFGYTVGLDGVTVGAVTPGYPASRAGLRTGDRLNFAAEDMVARSNSALTRAVVEGTVLHLEVERGGHVHRIAMKPRAFEARTQPFFGSLDALASLAFVAIGIALVLVKPNRMTWGLLLWGLAPVITAYWTIAWAEHSPLAFLAISLVQNAVCGLGCTGFVMFVSRFPGALPQPRLRWLDAAAIPYGALVFAQGAAVTLYVAASPVPPPSWLLSSGLYAVPIVNFAIAIVALAATLTTRQTRSRMVVPVMASVTLTAGLATAAALQEFIFIEGTIITALHVFVSASLLLIAASVAYGVARHRLVDAQFVFGRTLVFSIISATVVGLLILVHRVAVEEVPLDSMRTFLEIAGATSIGVAVPRIHGLIGMLLDRTIFVKRYRSERTLAQVAEAIEYADDASTIAELAVRQPVSCLNLESAAFFVRRPNGDFVCAASTGWPAGGSVLGHNDLLVLCLQAEPHALPLAPEHVERQGFPTGSHAPIVAMPIVVRKELAAIAFYGAPSNGSRLDADQMRLLERVVKAASFAHDAIALGERAREANRERDLAQSKLVQTLRGHVEELESLNGARARFIPNEFIAMLGKDTIANVQLGDHVEREMTVLFADIRDFAGIAEQLAPSESFEFLNAYLNRVGPLIREHGGFVDKYIGDSIMALFPRDADSALAAALALQREVRAYNATLEAQGMPRLRVGVGLHYGKLMLGTVGERARMETTVISDAVNLASRMEGVTKIYGASVVLSGATVERLSRAQQQLLRPLGTILVKGKQRPVELFEAYGGDEPAAVVAKRASSPRFADALHAFSAGNWDDARTVFESLYAENPDDAVVLHFVQRCNALLESTGSIAWDGIERLQTK